MIGHNQPSFDDVVQENLNRGLLLSIKNVIVAAIDDPRLDRRHLRVLALVIEHINTTSGMAYPGRKKLAADSGSYGREPYTEGTVAVTIAELMQWGYLVYDKRGPESGGRALSHYTIRKPSTEDLQAEITAWVRVQTAARLENAGKEPWKRKADVNHGVAVKNSEVKDGVHVNPSLNVRSDVNPVVSADVNPVVSTVTSIGTRRKTPECDDEGVTGNPEFEAFWESYPRKVGKAAALRTFTAIVTGKHKDIDKTSSGRLIRGAKGYAHHCAKERLEKQYMPHPQTWLNRASWLDETAELPEEKPAVWWQNQSAVAKLKAEDWKRGIDKWCDQFWNSEQMGPPPGEPGCIVPQRVVEDLNLREIFDHRGLRRS